MIARELHNEAWKQYRYSVCFDCVHCGYDDFEYDSITNSIVCASNAPNPTLLTFSACMAQEALKSEVIEAADIGRSKFVATP